jgi:hypothetical protein
MKKILIADLVKQSYEEYKDQRDIDILDLIEKFKLSEEDASYLYDNFKETDYEWVVEVATKLKIPVADVIEDSGTDHIEYLIQQVESDRISLDTAQEDAWVYYGYPEGGEATSSSSSWAGLWAGGSETIWNITYEPIFESLGDTLDDDPYWSVYITIETINDKYPHFYSGEAKDKPLEAIQDLEESGSCARWFNTYCGDHRFK